MNTDLIELSIDSEELTYSDGSPIPTHQPTMPNQKLDEHSMESETCALLPKASSKSINLPIEESSSLSSTTSNGLMPRSVYFIIGNEFCERFSFYGMKAILGIYLIHSLKFTENSSTIIIHSFNFLAYFFSLIGGIIADCFLGKYRTILYLSIIYCAGSVILSASALSQSVGWNSWIALVGLATLALGTGGIKPCVSSFGGDQFDQLETENIARFFSVFYFTVNAGSVLSMFITPILRQDVHCFGQDSCFPLAFALPSALMVIAVGIFVAGKTLYRHIATEGNALMDIYHVYQTAFRCKRSSIDQSKPLLEYAKQEIAPEKVSHVQQVAKVLTLLLPTPAFWALYDQQSSNWTFQAMQMDNKVSSLAIKPEQMQIVNSFLILACIPLFDRVVYPFARRLGIKCSFVQKIACGMILAAGSFVASAIVQSKIQQGTFVPNPTTGLLECTDRCTSIMWQIPQYILITCGEIMFSITGLEFAYSQAPGNMKSFCQSFWLMTVAVGNLVVIGISCTNAFAEAQAGKPANAPNSQIGMYLTFVCVQLMAVVWFLWLSRGFAPRRESVMLVEEQE